MESDATFNDEKYAGAMMHTMSTGTVYTSTRRDNSASDDNASGNKEMDSQETVRDVLSETAGAIVAKKLLEEGAEWALIPNKSDSRADTKNRSGAIEMGDLQGVKGASKSVGEESMIISGWMLKCQQ
eukprot:1672036-Rhodomonas_salina.5